MNTVIKEHGKLDILCNNAGVAEQPDWEKTFNVNLGGVIRGTKLGLELMSSGVIINTSSVAGIRAKHLLSPPPMSHVMIFHTFFNFTQ
ncbi:15-hydroxyprostaglandin dehydrogenase [NAD(+)]-like [Exaiptasia diaphana]|uniref:15-hydroxyprostaglandin dehydrogenase [NAD(+)] n=1 Tax=Exaiptasia diaphana TaxID=2652724 RepID=A0A913YFL0_EXADI|nr:15-hydroxyprostaglandin dehydrogenase [NAD(+)]-like [Exaiptasia diaphana]